MCDASQAAAYYKVSSHEAKKGEFKKCLLLFSGGLDTSVMLKWIKEQYDCEMISLTIDIGQMADNMDEIKAKAIKLGALEAVVYDAKKEFAETILTEAIMANADYQGGYSLGCPLGRVMISKIAVEVANKYGCQVIAHGCTGKGNDQVRFEGYITTLNPNLKTIAPVREWGMGREEEIKYAEEHGIPVRQKKDSPYSYDENMWSNTAEGGEIENPSLIPPLERILLWCNTVDKAPAEGVNVQINFHRGVPTHIDGQYMPVHELIPHLNRLGGKHACGFFHLIEDRVVGLKVRGIYENPAAAILVQAHKKLEMLTSTREENEFKHIVDNKWAYMTYGAKWFDPLMAHIRAFIHSQNQKVTGKVVVRLHKGNITVVACESDHSLFNVHLATFERSAAFNQNASAGFIELWNLPQKTAYNAARSLYEKQDQERRANIAQASAEAANKKL